MSCRDCDNFSHEEYCCTVQCGLYNPDSAESEGCPYWEPESEREEEDDNETCASGCLIMFLLLPFLLIMKIV